MNLSIIIVNYRAWNSLAETLDGLIQIHTDQFTFEVIVVDNLSGDGQIEAFRKRYPSYIFYENDGNWGFANACNRGAQLAKGAYYLFLNPDTVPNATTIDALYQTGLKDPAYGMLSCLQNNRNELNIKLWPSLATLVGFTRMLFRILNYRKLRLRSCACQDIAHPDWLSGSIILISRLWFQKVGGWDDDFWMYSEDTDLSHRIVESGGKIGLLCKFKMIHLHGGASRIDPTTTRLTKAEVKISTHVYIQKHFLGLQKQAGHGLMIFNNVLINFPAALLGSLLFFIPFLQTYSQIYRKTLQYYWRVLNTGNWLSPRSRNYKL